MQIPPFNSLDRVVGVLLPPSFLVLLFPLHWNASLPPPAALTDPDMFSMSSFLFWSLWQNLIHLFSLMNFAFILEITNLLYQIKVALLLQPKTTSQWRNRESWKRRVDFNLFSNTFVSPWVPLWYLPVPGNQASQPFQFSLTSALKCLYQKKICITKYLVIDYNNFVCLFVISA